MKLLTALAFAMPVLAAAQTPFRLAPGEYRWIPFTVRQTPVEIECRFHVVRGSPTVHLEVLPINDFRLFNRGREHEALAVSPKAGSADLRQLVEDRGEYAVVVMNNPDGPVADVVLEVSTSLHPGPAAAARELTPGRRLAVILISFAIFFVTVMWSGMRLIRAATKSSAAVPPRDLQS